MRIPHSPLLVAVALAVAAPASGQAPDAARARDIASTCANCHGTGGLSRGGTESLAGKPQAELVTKFQEFKQGKRPGTIMPQIARGFTDEQIDLVSAWLAAQPTR